MELSKSKLALAKVINENGGWVDGAKWAAQDKRDSTYKLKIWFYSGNEKPYTAKGCTTWKTDCIIHGTYAIQHDKLLPNWHQTCLSIEEYYQAYPVSDADGWIEWNGGECPVEGGSIVDVELNDGRILSGLAISFSWLHEWAGGNIIKYRKHKKPKAQPECLGKINPIIPASIDELCAKVTEENKHQHVDTKPTIEHLAQDYRNKLDFANSKQQEADDAKAAADAALGELERAGEEIWIAVVANSRRQEARDKHHRLARLNGWL